MDMATGLPVYLVRDHGAVHYWAAEGTGTDTELDHPAGITAGTAPHILPPTLLLPQTPVVNLSRDQ